MINLMEKKKNIVFVDEAVFSSKLDHGKSWWLPGNKTIVVDRNSLGFKAVGVVAGINMLGKVVAVHMELNAIDKHSFVVFLKKVRKYNKGRKTYIFLDNLTVHYTDVVKSAAKKYNQELIFNANYSSQLNPIESLWGMSKRHFSRSRITDDNSRD